MDKTIPFSTSQEIEKAITFLVTHFNETGHNSKPVIFHSLRVGFLLLQYGYDKKVIIAAILHDLVEDSNVTIDIIKKNFGDDVGLLVAAASFDPNIKDKEEQFKEMFDRTKKAGIDALLIKAADIYDNSFYYKLVSDPTNSSVLLKKLKYFLDISEDLIGKEPLWVDLQKRYEEENHRMGHAID